MKNFKEIADKCLNGEFSGTFITRSGIKIHSGNFIEVYDGTGFGPKHYYTVFIGLEIFCSYYTDGQAFDINNQYLSDLQIINFIPDMKENDKRTIQISLHQAREWYNSGNDTLKTLALSSFSKKELDPYPRSFDEYFKKYSNGSNILKMYPTKELQEKFNAYIKLMSLRYDWIHIWSQEQGFKEDWESKKDECWCIVYLKENNILTVTYFNAPHPLSFPTHELASEFCNTFESLLEQAKGLY